MVEVLGYGYGVVVGDVKGVFDMGGLLELFDFVVGVFDFFLEYGVNVGG